MSKGQDSNKKALRRADSYTKKIELIYDEFIKECAKLGLSINDYDPDKPFQWKKYPQTKARIDKLIKELYSQIKKVIDEATKKEWEEAQKARKETDDLFFLQQRLEKEKERQNIRNQEALTAFQFRKINGLNLSGRIWNISEQARKEMEMALDVGLSDGRSAAELSRDIRDLLNEPKRLYRRIRNKETGAFYLSKNAKLYNPGRGMYRSSYKNAMRIARTEINMAYRTSDVQSMEDKYYIVGYEVHRSNHVYDCPMCEQLKGKYPKTFKYATWHPQCRCYITAIFADRDEIREYQEKRRNGENPVMKSRNEVKEPPEGFKQWMNENSEKIAKSKSKPYFIRDNFSEEQIQNGDWEFKASEPEQQTTPAKRVRTQAEIDRIKAEWKASRERAKKREEERIRKEEERKRQAEIPTPEEEASALLFTVESDPRAYPQDWWDTAKKYNLTDAEAMCLHGYTAHDYTVINQILRGDLTGHEKVRLDNYKAYEKVLNSALNKMESNEDIVYRGVRYGTESYEANEATMSRYLEAFKNKTVLTENAFVSTSIKENMSESFGKDYKFKILSKTAKNIQPLSAFQDEQERLFKSGTQFIVKDYKQITVNGKDYIEIEMEEV